MATCTSFAQTRTSTRKNALCKYSHSTFTSLASPCKTVWRMSASLVSPRKTVWQISASLVTPCKTICRMSGKSRNKPNPNVGKFVKCHEYGSVQVLSKVHINAHDKVCHFMNTKNIFHMYKMV
jgi:hypothetical protein